MGFLSDLPIEVLTDIISYLPAKDIGKLSIVSKIFYEASQVESIWKRKCHEDFKILSIGSELSYRTFYTKLLFKYGRLIGLWQTRDGEVVTIKHTEGDLKCTKFILTEEFEVPATDVNYFMIALDSTSGQRIISMQVMQPEDRRGHIWNIERITGDYCSTITNNSFKLLLSKDAKNYKENKQFKKKCERNWLFKKQCLKHSLKRVKIPEKRVNVPVQPGLFIGTYGPHGLEYIMLDYSKDSSTATALKITGDNNVPAGAITFRAQLDKSISVLNCDQDLLNELDAIIPDYIPYNSNNKNVEPFILPSRCTSDGVDIPDKSIARFLGEGQIADTGFKTPEFIKGHWIVFNEDLFAFMWFDLYSLNFYRRAVEVLPL